MATMDKEAIAEQAREQAAEEVNEFCSEVELYYVSQDGKFWIYDPKSEKWFSNSPEALKASDYRIRKPINYEVLLRSMQAAGQNKAFKTYSFNETPSTVLNLMRARDWLEPIKGRTENTVFFDYLITALSGSNPQNVKHIKQVLGWKYLHPETWQLPALCFYGKGGAGKNLLCEKVLPTIFGARACAKVSFKHVERFNDAIAGKTVVLFDERPARDDESFLKMTIQQPTISIEPKGGQVFDAENTPLYIIATNGEQGPVRLEKNGVDRRYSIIKIKETLIDVICRSEDVDVEMARQMIVAADKDIYGNDDEVARFLNECIEEAEKLDMHPHALHGDDFVELADTQTDVVDDLLQEVFIDYEDFTDISITTLYEMYKARTKVANPGASPLSAQNFNGRAMNFILNNGLDKEIARTDIRVNIKKGNEYIAKAKVFYKIDKFDGRPGHHEDKTDFFLSNNYNKQEQEKSETQPASNLLGMGLINRKSAFRKV